MPQRRAKHWCFTLNNYNEDDVARISNLHQGEKGERCTYVIFGKEVGKQGTRHLQGYMTFAERIALATVRRIIGGQAHLEPAKGTPKQAADYCKKDGDFLQFGDIPLGQGARSDLKRVFTAIQDGRSNKEIAEENPGAFLKYSTGILRAKAMFRPSREGPPQIWVFWGKTGSGKTKRVWEFADADKLWLHPGGKWFDGYDNHPAVLFDDFAGSWFTLTYLLKLLDRYIFQVPIKGSFTWWCPKTIYITCNEHPKEWYQSCSDHHKAALMRRLTEFGTIQKIE